MFHVGILHFFIQEAMNKKKLKEIFFSFDNIIRNVLDKTTVTHALYAHVILPIETEIFRAGNYKISTSFRQELENVRNLYFTEEEKKNPKLSKKIEKDLVKTLISHRMKPEEFFLYGLRDKGYWERKEFLSDTERRDYIVKYEEPATYKGIDNKKSFYVNTKDYFHRDVCIIDKDGSKSDFIDFALRHDYFLRNLSMEPGEEAPPSLMRRMPRKLRNCMTNWLRKMSGLSSN